MNARLRRNTFWFICASALAALLVACGDPGAGNPRFTFDRVPVVTSIYGTPVSFDPQNCAVFAADEVQVLTAELDSVDQIKRWAVDHGFTLLRENLGLSDALLLFQVPPGSVPEVEALFTRQPGVRAASRNLYLRFPESTDPPLVTCTPDPR